MIQWAIAFNDRISPRYHEFDMNIYAANQPSDPRHFDNTLLALENHGNESFIHRWYGFSIKGLIRHHSARVKIGEDYVLLG
jgi:hypothetical protein